MPASTTDRLASSSCGIRIYCKKAALCHLPSAWIFHACQGCSCLRTNAEAVCRIVQLREADGPKDVKDLHCEPRFGHDPLDGVPEKWTWARASARYLAWVLDRGGSQSGPPRIPLSSAGALPYCPCSCVSVELPPPPGCHSGRSPGEPTTGCPMLHIPE